MTFQTYTISFCQFKNFFHIVEGRGGTFFFHLILILLIESSLTKNMPGDFNASTVEIIRKFLFAFLQF